MKIAYYTGWLLTRIVSKLVFRIRISGQEHIPTSGGFILATNHRSNFDPLLVGSWSTRQMYFLAKKELFRNPVFGGLIRRTNALPVNRGAVDRDGLKMCADVVHKGFGLTIFPEGTRSRTTEFLPAKPGIGMIACQAGCPIVPGYVHGSNMLSRCFRGSERMLIRFGEPLSADWVRSFEPKKESYQAIAEAVMQRIASLRSEAFGER